MNKILCSILISNYNKEKYIKNCLESCINQTYENIEIIFADNSSTDNSLNILKEYPKIKTIKIERSTEFPAINQLQTLLKALKVSKGQIIFLLDSDDFFNIDKVEKILQLYNKDQNKKFICDIPNIVNKNSKKKFKYKKKFNVLTRWPTIFPTSSISLKREFFFDLKNYLFENEFTKLEIDFRLNVLAYNINKNYFIFSDNLSNYLKTNDGIMSRYFKFSPRWWKKRMEAHLYLKKLLEINNLKHKLNLDYLVTKIINSFITII